MKICVFQLGFGGEGGMREEGDSVYFSTVNQERPFPGTDNCSALS